LQKLGGRQQIINQFQFRQTQQKSTSIVIFIISFSIIIGSGRTEYYFPYFGKPC
jgi:hypothetical protein